MHQDIVGYVVLGDVARRIKGRNKFMREILTQGLVFAERALSEVIRAA